MNQTIPIKTLAELPAYHAAHQGNKTVLSFEGRNTTFGQFDTHTNQIANGLIAMGLSPGDRIAFLGKNSDWYFELLFGAIKAGVVLAPVGWRLAEPEVLFILENSEAKILFVEHDFHRESFNPERLPKLASMISMGGESPDLIPFDQWRNAQSKDPPGLVFKPDDIAIQVYTSGTTGRPKGAMLTHRNFIRMRELLAAQGSEVSKYLPDDISLLAMPVSHVGGTSTGVWAIYHGIKSVVSRQFDPDDVLDFIQRDGVNNFFLVPSALQRIVRDPRAQTVDFSRLRYIIYGGGPMPRELLAECMRVFKCGFSQGYGMTETCATIMQLPPEDHTLDGSPRLRSCGKPLPGVEIALRDETGNPVPTGQVGEIVTRSPGNMAGYWRDPEATARTIDAEGWLRTGDAGYFDEDGYCRPREGHDRVRRRKRLSGRSRERDLRASRGGGGCRHRRALGPVGRGGESRRRPEGRRFACGSRRHRVGEGAHCRVQGAQERRFRRCAAEERRGQDPSPRTARPLLGGTRQESELNVAASWRHAFC